MTLTDVLKDLSAETTDFMEKSPEETMCEVVNTAICQAARDGRLTQGLAACVTALSRNPEEVVICILPTDTTSANVNLNIQMLLIESVCVEYGILILKLDINQLGSGLTPPSAASELSKSILAPAAVKVTSELDCFLIQHGENGLSVSDKKLLHTFQNMWSDEDVMEKDFVGFPD